MCQSILFSFVDIPTTGPIDLEFFVHDPCIHLLVFTNFHVPTTFPSYKNNCAQQIYFLVPCFESCHIYMGQKLQDGKKVLEMSVTTLHSKCRPIQTIHPTDLGLLPSWISISRPPAQEFSPSCRPWMPGNVCRKGWNSRKFQEIYIFKKTSEKFKSC